MIVALDADVLIGALDRHDAHHDRARDLISVGRREGLRHVVSLVNLTEVLVAQVADNARLAIALEALQAWGVTSHQPTEAIAVEAARLRSRHRISLADAYLIATARHTKAAVASFDQRLNQAAAAEQILLAVG